VPNSTSVSNIQTHIHQDIHRLFSGCAQVTLTGGGSANPPKIAIPGAYKGSDSGITVSLLFDLKVGRLVEKVLNLG
jgi:hypothetical protein